MSTPQQAPSQQTLANQANAQLSTSHGLTATSIDALSEANQAEFAALASKLRQQLRPHGPAEEETFAAYAWNTFQADRARAFEAHASAAYEEALLKDIGQNEPISPAIPTSSLRQKARQPNSFSLAQDHILGLGKALR
ncbi:MAG: hypothetical protein NW208_03435 [Bryobacter sp.]|nr:hypothetical protein [Bryobacter sp.]